MNSSLNPVVVGLRNVSRNYGAKKALCDVTLEIPRGGVTGLIGANGAGKTTLIRHILGLLRAQTGSVSVLGMDPVKHPVKVLARLGYLSEDRDLPPWLSVGELLGYGKAFYADWDAAYAERLRVQFGLRPDSVVRTLSKGELAKAGLLMALAHRPELLILDEPSSGLDPLVRREMLEAIVRSVGEEGRTVLFSSHLLDEVARVADRLAMLVNGRLVLAGAMDEVLECHRRLVVRPSTPQPPSFPGALSVTGGPDEYTCICNGASEELRPAVSAAHGEVIEDSAATIEEIFQARTMLNAPQGERTSW